MCRYETVFFWLYTLALCIFSRFFGIHRVLFIHKMSDLNNSSAYMFLLSHFLRLIDCKCTLMALKLKTFMFYLFALTETDTFIVKGKKDVKQSYIESYYSLSTYIMVSNSFVSYYLFK